MIDEERTKELFGYTSNSLSHGSHKRVVAVCDGCGKVRIIQYCFYRDSCLGCALKSEDRRYKIGSAQKGGKHTEEQKKKISDANSGEKNHNYGKRMSDDQRKKISNTLKGTKHSDERRRKQSDAIKGEKNHNYGKRMSDEQKKKISDANSGEKNHNYGKNISDEQKKKISDALKGENHPQWRGGVSFEPYCPKFNEAFKESMREKFGRICFLCSKTELENGQKLSVHHVNYDKNCLCDDVKCEFVPLCTSCHSKTNFNQEYWENLIMEKLKTDSRLLDQFSNK